MHSFNDTKAGYGHLWDMAKVYSPRLDAEAAAHKVANTIAGHKTQYQEVEKATRVPWWAVGGMHYRESSNNFNTYLGNGQSLSRVTTEVPSGRGPFPNFQAGAIDALNYQFHAVRTSVPDPATIEWVLWFIEAFNGQGYYSLNINSPYLWNWTDQYQGGKYVADHQFSSSVWDVQGGVAAIFKELFKLDSSIVVARDGTPIVLRPPIAAPALPVPVPSVPPIPVGGNIIETVYDLMFAQPARIASFKTEIENDLKALSDKISAFPVSTYGTTPLITPAKGESLMNAITNNPVTSTLGGGSLFFAAFQLFNGIASKDPNLIGQGVLALITGLMGLVAKDGHK